jgi:hypothetical protein
VVTSEKGTPQGGPLSPLLADICLDALDKELDERGHSYCRYADDCNIYVSSQAAAERTPTSIQDWIEKRLRLKVNPAKSGTGRVLTRGEAQYWSYRRDKSGVALRGGQKVPGLSTEPQTANRNRTGEHSAIQSESAGTLAKRPEFDRQ